jgi:hypothetical protein
VAYAETELGHALVSDLLPIHCRKALEAAVAQRIRRDKLGSGVLFADVEREISDCHGVNKLLALARFGNANKGAQVLPPLNNNNRRLTDAYRASKEGSHGGSASGLTSALSRPRGGWKGRLDLGGAAPRAQAAQRVGGLCAGVCGRRLGRVLACQGVRKPVPTWHGSFGALETRGRRCWGGLVKLLILRRFFHARIPAPCLSRFC